MRRALGLVAVAAFVLTGCGGPTPENPKPDAETTLSPWESIRVYRQALPDGHTVTCLVYSGDKKGGLSCDWGAK